MQIRHPVDAIEAESKQPIQTSEGWQLTGDEMIVRPVLRRGHPFLRQKVVALQVFATPELAGLNEDLRDTMAAHDGAGLAAPQIGMPRRVVFHAKANPRYPEAPPIPETVLIPPHHSPWPQRAATAGGLSVPGMRWIVPRWERTRDQGFDAQGKRIDHSVDGFHARAAQHACDHLDGVLCPDRIEDRTAFG